MSLSTTSGELIEITAENKYLFHDLLFDKLTAETFSQINLDSIVFVAIASSGAMGWSGACQFFTKEGDKIKKYAMAPECMPPSEELDNFRKMLDKSVWRPYYLGVGNHLYIKSEYYKAFTAEVEKLNPSHRGIVYQNWCKIAHNILTAETLKYHWNNDELIDLLARVCFAEGSLLTDMLHLPKDRYNQTLTEIQSKEFDGLDADKAKRACECGMGTGFEITADTLKYWNGGDFRSDCADETAKLLKFINNERAAHPLIRTAVAYAWLLKLQAFAENNDLTARYLMLAMLSKHEHLPERFYAITEVFFEDESSYRQALETTLHGDKNLTEWVYFFLNSMLKAIRKSLLKYVRESIKTAREKVRDKSETKQ